MCYSPDVDRIALRELRNQASRVVRRARAGERLIITVDGVPVAEIGPLTTREPASIEALIAAGEVMPPRSRATPRPAKPLPAPSGKTIADVLGELRER